MKPESTPDKNNTVFFTGHRFLPSGGIDEITGKLDRAIEDAFEKGYTVFLAGGALAFDMLCAERVLEMKKSFPEYV